MYNLNIHVNNEKPRIFAFSCIWYINIFGYMRTLKYMIGEMSIKFDNAMLTRALKMSKND